MRLVADTSREKPFRFMLDRLSKTRMIEAMEKEIYEL